LESWLNKAVGCSARALEPFLTEKWDDVGLKRDPVNHMGGVAPDSADWLEFGFSTGGVGLGLIHFLDLKTRRVCICPIV